ncbi:MAG TPA: DUF4157 domain-containing protein, partial [Kofleriaceae bacterium]|nr:DUF4157 domain-containing protein [Kofleriaceae bacterium]
MWRALARSTGISEELARALWARAEAESGKDPIRTERTFRRLVDEAQELGQLARGLDGDAGLLDPGKWTRVLDLQNGDAKRGDIQQSHDVPGPKSEIDASALDPATRLRQAFEKMVTKGEVIAETITHSDGDSIRDALRKFRNGQVGSTIAGVDNGGLDQILRIADALISIAEHDRDFRAGKPLPTNLRAELESKLGIDFSDVRVHDDSKAAREASSHGAVAFARGKNVYFADGAYDPSSAEGKRLIAHEVVHVAQQRAGGNAAPGSMSEPGSAVEREADRIANAFAGGPVAGAGAFRVRESAAAGTISRKTEGDSDKKITKWSPRLVGQALDLGSRFVDAYDAGEGKKEFTIPAPLNRLGPLKLTKAQFKPNEAGDKVEQGTLFAKIDSGALSGTEGHLTVDANEGVSGKLTIPVNAPNMLSIKEVSVEVGAGEISTTVRVKPDFKASKHFAVKETDFEVTISSKAGELELKVIGHTEVEIKNGFADGAGKLDLDLKANKEGVSFNAFVNGEIKVAGLAEAKATIFFNGEKLEMTAGGTVPFNLPGLKGSANIKYEGGKLSLDSKDLHFTWPKLAPINFSEVALGGESKVKAELHLNEAISVDVGGATISLEDSSIKIDGKKVEGHITGGFALNNAGGFKAKAKIGYADEGGFTGEVSVEGGATVNVGPAKVTINEGSKLTVSKTPTALDIAGDISATAKIPALGDLDAHLIAAKGKPIDLTIDAKMDMKKIQKDLRGELNVKYKRSSGSNAFALSATNVGVQVGPLKDKTIFSSVTGTYENGKVTANLTAASGTEIVVSEGSSVTINSGHITLADKKLDGHLDATGKSGGSEVKATIGWKDGHFDWAAEGNFELGGITNHMLEGSVHAAAGSDGTGNFVSNGPITFGNEKLKDIEITHLEGNKQTNKYVASIQAEKAINKAVKNVPDVQIESAGAGAKITYDNGKLSFGGMVQISAKYPKSGDPEVSGTLRLEIPEGTTDLHGEIVDITVKKGDFFESKGGKVDLNSGQVDLGKNSTFKIPGVAEGKINSASFNIKTKEFAADIDVDPKQKALDGVQFNVTATNNSFVAKLRANTPPIALGSFATATLGPNSQVSITKASGLVADLEASVVAPNVGKGDFHLHYETKTRKFTGNAKVTVDPFAVFDKVDIDVRVDENRQVSTNKPIEVSLAPNYTDQFVASATVEVTNNKFDVKGQVKEIRNLGSVSDAFKEKGAQIHWSQGGGVTIDAGIAMHKVIPQLAEGSDLTLHYANKVFTINGTLKPKTLGPVTFKPESHITANWTSNTKQLIVSGHATADIANLCEAEMTVRANAGGGLAGSFHLDGKIDATKLSEKVPGVKFSSVVATFGVDIGGGAPPALDFGLKAGITSIADFKVAASLDANYKSGEGFGGTLAVTRAELGPVIADGSIVVEKNKFKEGNLHMMADFPTLKIEGNAKVTPGEMGGLDTAVKLTVTPAKTSAIAEFVQSGEINVDIKKWKVMKAEGILNLVPPSFLPLVDPKIVISYVADGDLSATLKTQFKAPMAKNNEMGNFEAGYSKSKGLFAHIDFPLTVPGFQATTVYGDLDQTSAKVGVKLRPKDDSLVKEAVVELGYIKGSGFFIEGRIKLTPTETLTLDVGLRYSSEGGLQVIGMEPDDKDANNDEHTVGKFGKSISVPLLTVGVAQLALKFGIEVGAGYRMPKIKFKNPKLEGGLDALDKGGMPSFTFGGSIAMGAYVYMALSVQIVGEIQLLIATASAGIGAEIMARLNLELGADVDGRYQSGQGALITIDPYVAASLDLVASLIATLYASIGWWTIVDKKWTLAQATLAHIDLGRFQPFQPVGLQFGGPGGTKLTRGLSLREDAFDNVEKGVKEGGQKAADNESNREAREKITPVLQAFKNAAPQFQELPEGWEKGMVAAPVDFSSMFPVQDKHWKFYEEHADQAEDMVPELRMSTPTERLAKAVAVTAKKDPTGAGRLVLGWRRAQIAAKGINPDTGVNVIEERVIVQQLIEEKYQKDLKEAQEKQKKQDEDHAAQVAKQAADFGKAEVAHAQVGIEQKTAFDQNVNKIQGEWDKAQEKKAEAGKAAAQEGAQVKPVAQEKAPPPAKPAPPPMPKPLSKPAPIPVPPPIPLPPPAEVLPAVTLPALPADPGVSVKAAGVIPPQKKKAEVQSPGKKDAPQGGAPNPTPGATSNTAAQSAGAGGSPMPQGEGNQGGAPKVGGSTTATPPPGPKVAAGPDGIISQNKTIDGKHKQYDPSFKPAGVVAMPTASMVSALFGDKKGPDKAKPGDGAKPGGPEGAPGGDAAKAGAAKPGAGAVDPSVQKVIDEGKAGQQQQKAALDGEKQKYDKQVDQKNAQTAAETKKLDAAAAEAKKKKEEEKKAADAKAAAAAAAPKPGDEKDKDKKAKGPIGVKVSLDILGESHTLYIDELTGVAMVASTPTPVSTKIGEAESAIKAAPDSLRTPAYDTVQTTKTAATTLDTTAKKAFAGDESAKSAAASDQQTLSNPLKITWSWLKVAQDPAVTSGSIDKPLLHPYYNTFKGRVALMSMQGKLNVNVAPFTEDIWIKICEAVKKAQPAMTDPAAYSDFAKGWLDMKSPVFKNALKEFDKIGDELAKAGKSAFGQATSFGFWSKDEGRSLAESMSGSLTLETSAIGGLMDGMPTLDGKKAGWDPEMWGALSNAYANAVVPEIVKGKKVKVCVGAGVPAGNIWEAVESVALEHGLKQAGISLESVTTHYAAAAKSKKDRRTLDETKSTGGYKGCLYVGDRPGAIAAANAHFATVPEGNAPVVPAPTPVAAAPAANAAPPAGAAPANA